MDFYKLLALTLTITPIGLAHAGPTSMTREALKEYPDGASYWEVDVTCSTSREPRVIQRKDNSKTWCAKEAPDLCKKDKIAMAAFVCSSRYRVTVADESAQEKQQQQSEAALPAPQQQAATEQQTALGAENATTDTPSSDLEQQKNQLSVEKERLLIEQQRLELRRQEIELKKEELRLKGLLEEAKQTSTSAKPRPVEQNNEKVTSNNNTSKVPTLFRTKDANSGQ